MCTHKYKAQKKQKRSRTALLKLENKQDSIVVGCMSTACQQYVWWPQPVVRRGVGTYSPGHPHLLEGTCTRAPTHTQKGHGNRDTHPSPGTDRHL